MSAEKLHYSHSGGVWHWLLWALAILFFVGGLIGLVTENACGEEVKGLGEAKVVKVGVGPTQSAHASPSRFWTKGNVFLLALDSGAKFADYHYTMRNQMAPIHHESDPIARPFVNHRWSAGMFFGGQVAVDGLVSWALTRRGHGRWAKAVVVGGVVDNGTGAWWSARNYQRKR